VVPRDFTLDEIDHVLGNIRRAVANPLHMPADGKEMERRLDQMRMRPHRFQQLVDDPPVVFVHFVVATTNLASRVHVLIHKRIERLVNHVRRPPKHPLELGRQLELRILHERNRPLGDVYRQIGNPFELGINLEHRRRAAQIHRHRLMQRENLEAFLLDLDFARVNLLFALDHLARDQTNRFGIGASPRQAPDNLGIVIAFRLGGFGRTGSFPRRQPLYRILGGAFPAPTYAAAPGRTYPELIVALASGERVEPHVGEFRDGVTFTRYYWQLELDEQLRPTGREILPDGASPDG